MGLLNPAQAYGDVVNLARTNARHLFGAGAEQAPRRARAWSSPSAICC